MITWLLLTGAVLSEVMATLSLKAAQTTPAFYAVVVGGYAAAFFFLSTTLGRGLPLGVAYGIWAAAGVALTALASKPLFGEPLTPTMLAGIGLIMLGVLLVELGAGH